MKKFLLFSFAWLLSLSLFAQHDTCQHVAYVQLCNGDLACTDIYNSVKTITVNGVSFDMVWVEGGTFQMGSDYGYNGEQPVHSVTLDGYYIGKYEVTQALWLAVMDNKPSYFEGMNNPVESVSWRDCYQFVLKINQLTGLRFSLPSEAQWEFAARGGNMSKGYTYSGSNRVDSVAWYYDISGDKTHPVGQLLPNELGIYDMSGNVMEWCLDWHSNSFYSNSPSRNPVNSTPNTERVVRGGSMRFSAESCGVAVRSDLGVNRYSSDLGFRLVLIP